MGISLASVGGVDVSVGPISATAVLVLGVGEGGGALVGVSYGRLVGLGMGEGNGTLITVGVGESGATAVGVDVIGRGGVLVGLGVAVGAAAGVAKAVGVAAPLTSTWPFSTVTDWASAWLSSTWTFCSCSTLMPSPRATQVIVANTPEPLGPVASPKLMAPRLILPCWLSTVGPMGITERPVLPRKSPRVASVTCTMDGR